MVEPEVWKAFIAQGYIRSSMASSLQSFMHVTNRLIVPEHANTPMGISLVKRLIARDDMWSQVIIGIMGKFGTSDFIADKLTQEEQFYCMVTQIGERSPIFCQILVPVLERIKCFQDHGSIGFLFPIDAELNRKSQLGSIKP